MINIPESYINGLNIVPNNISIGIIMRHAERFDIKKGEVGLDVSLTNDGVLSAIKLGDKYLKSKISKVYSSRVTRCINTAKNILKGALQENINIEILPALFGDEFFVNDFSKMSKFYMNNGMLSLLDLAYERKKIDGLNSIDKSVHQFINLIIEKIDDNDSGISLFVTHDMFISLIAGEIFRHKTDAENWPDFMEPIFIWKEDSNIKLFFRTYLKTISSACLID